MTNNVYSHAKQLLLMFSRFIFPPSNKKHYFKSHTLLCIPLSLKLYAKITHFNNNKVVYGYQKKNSLKEFIKYLCT